MLATQIQYLNFLEQKRHNEATEIEQYRSNRRSEFLKLREIENQAVKYSADIKQNAQRLANDRFNIEQQAEVAQRNAVTNRMNALNTQRKNFQDWNLGLQANSIAQQNARTNAINAQTREGELTLGYGNLAVSQGRLGLDTGVNWMNAQTNRMNAQTQRKSLQVQQEHYRWSDTAALINSSANVANAIFRGVQTYPSIAQTAFVMGRV